MKNIKDIKVTAANVSHLNYVTEINDSIDLASKERGTGIARRSDEYITNKITEGKAIIALEGETFAGFCYIESWGHNRFVANSGLIVVRDYRGIGLAREIKRKAFELSRTKFPKAKIFFNVVRSTKKNNGIILEAYRYITKERSIGKMAEKFNEAIDL